MEGSDDLNPTQWVAVVATLLLMLVPLAVALAAWARRRYVAAVTTLQRELALAGSTPGEAPGLKAGPAPGPPPLRIDRIAAASAPADPAAAQPSRRLRRRVLGVQFVAGLLYWWLLLSLLLAAIELARELTAETPDAGSVAAHADQVATVAAAPGQGDTPAAVGATSPPDARDGGDAGASEAPADAQMAATATEDDTGLSAHLAFWSLAALPAVFGWAFQAGLPERHVWAGAGGIVLLFGIGLVGLDAGWLAAAVVTGTGALLAAMLAAFLRPAVRGAGPPLVAALTVGLIVLSAGMAVVVGLDNSPEDEPIGIVDWLLAALVLGALLALAVWSGRRMLMRLARRYEQRRFSEMQLALGAYWGLITAYASGTVLMLSFNDAASAIMDWVASLMLAAWFVWRGLHRLALRWARRAAAPPSAPLLMLRVFKPSARSEGFTDRFLARWRFAGPTWMIAGPDLAGGQMDPDEFFAFVRGRLRDHFIVQPDEIPTRVQALDDARDPDGRCRVHELFCSNATWQPTVLSLIDRAGVVLLDLREYHPGRAGTRFELEAVLQRLPLKRLLVLVDAREDPAPLEAAVTEAWAQVDPALRPDADTTLRLLAIGAGTSAEMDGLLAVAAHAAAQIRSRPPLPPDGSPAWAPA